MDISSVDYLKFVFALLFVLALIGGLAMFAKKVGLGHRGPMVRGQDKRLLILDTMPLDAKRRVILIRRDNKEHLLLLGSTSETVIEGNIDPPDTVAASPGRPDTAQVLALGTRSKVATP